MCALTLSLENTALEDITTTSSQTVRVCLCLAINANLPSQVLLVMDKITQETFILKVSGMCVLVVCACVCVYVATPLTLVVLTVSVKCARSPRV